MTTSLAVERAATGRVLLPAFLLACACAWSSPAAATDEVLREHTPTDHSIYRSPQYALLELRFGPYRPNVDAEFGGASAPFLDLYGAGQTVMFGLEGDWQALRIPHFGSLGPGVSVSYASFSAQALSTADPTQRSAQPTEIWFLPVSALAVLRVDVLARDFRIPLVPYGKLGATMALWETRDGGSVGVASGVLGQGISFGPTGALGLMFLLDFFAPQAAIDMDNSTGVNHAYLFGEWMLSSVSSFEQGLETGTSTWNVGLALEF